jgi:hypothetical protein
VVDVTHPAAPRLLSLTPPPPAASIEGARLTRALSVALQGSCAYVAWDADETPGGGLQIVDISDLSAPASSGVYVAARGASYVRVSEQLAFLPAYDDGVLVIDISDPQSPALATQYRDAPNLLAADVAVGNGKIYVANMYAERYHSGNLWILDFNLNTRSQREEGHLQEISFGAPAPWLQHAGASRLEVRQGITWRRCGTDWIGQPPRPDGLVQASAQ